MLDPRGPPYRGDLVADPAAPADPARVLLSRAVELGAQVDALAALVAHLRVETEDLPADPAVRALLTQIAEHLLDGTKVAALPRQGATAAVGLAGTFLRQAADLIENPGRSGGWDQVDVPLLQSIGRLSGAISEAVVAAEGCLEGLAEGLAEGLGGAGGRFLDVGTGVGWLAISMARQHPQLRVVGIDVFEPALALAAENVRAEGLLDRVELRCEDAQHLSEREAFDAIWLPMPFLPAEIVPQVVRAAADAVRPGGWVLPGTFTGPPTPLAQLLTDLRTVRSGGHPWSDDALLAVLTDAGLTDAQEVPRTWPAPARLFAARRPLV
jgi:2-polyprenyl-3-methyl-5-hydroxy-6-metoxy-1,4-benzoquinol methylase